MTPVLSHLLHHCERYPYRHINVANESEVHVNPRTVLLVMKHPVVETYSFGLDFQSADRFDKVSGGSANGRAVHPVGREKSFFPPFSHRTFEYRYTNGTLCDICENTSTTVCKSGAGCCRNRNPSIETRILGGADRNGLTKVQPPLSKQGSTVRH